MFKKLLPIFVLAILVLPTSVHATATSWDYAAGILQPLQSQWAALIKGSYFQATSTTASIFPFASTTALSATTLCLSTDCRTVWPSGSGGAFPFTPADNFGVNTSATSTPIWGQAGLFASSTSYLSTTTVYTQDDDGFVVEGAAVNHLVQFRNTNTSGAHLSFANSSTGYTTSDGVDFGVDVLSNIRILNHEAAGFRLLVNNSTEAITVLSSGLVGIGSTTPSTNLSVQGNGLFSGNLAVANLTATGTVTTANLTIDALTGFLKGTAGVVSAVTSIVPADFSLTKGNFLVGNDAGVAQATSSIFISSTGNVGIGVTAPVTKLSNSASKTTGTVSDSGFNWNISEAATYAAGIKNSNATGKGLHIETGGGAALVVETGNVGIGSTSPSVKLAVVGNGSGTGRAFSFAANNGVEKFIVQDNGYTGIGGIASPVGQLHVVNGFDISSTGGQIYFGESANYYGRIGFDEGGSTGLSFDTNYGDASSVMSFRLGGSEKFKVLGSNFGIGTTTPYAKLSVKGAGTTTGVNFQTTNSSNSPLFTILDSGNVGIGTANPSTGKLQIDGFNYSSNLITLQTSNQTARTYGLGMYSTGTGGGFSIRDNTAAADRLVITDTGSVGIGTTSPTTKLYVGGATAAAPSGTSDTGILTLQSTNTSKLSFGTFSSTPFGSWIQTGDTSNTSQIYPLSLNPLAGNVGIGTTSPAQKLDVYGNIAIGTAGSGGYIYGDTTNQYLRLSNSAGSLLGYSTSYINVAPSFIYVGGGVERFRITSTGYVGVGTNTPSTNLSVQGNGLFSGNLSLANLTATGTATLSALATPAGAFLAVNASGQVIATTSPSGGGISAVTGTYPVISSGGATPAISLAFGTTTANTWAGTQTFSGTVSVGTSLIPTSNDGAAVGNTTNQFSDLFLAEGGVINWDNGDAALTQAGNIVTLTGANLDVPSLALDSAGIITFGATNLITGDGIGNTVSFGTGAASGVIQSNGDRDFILQTGNAVTGSIQIQDGTNGNILLSPNGTGRVGIGTSSPYAKLSVDGRGVFNQDVRFDYFTATSTTATSTIAAGLQAATGYFSGLVEFAGNVIARAGTILDFSNATVKTHEYASFTYATSTAWTGTTTIPLGPAYTAEQFAGIKCFTDVGTLNVSLYDGTNRMNMFNASTTVGSVTLSTNNTFTASEARYVDIGTPATSPTKISCTTDRIVNN